MTGLLQDIRYALRQLRKKPGFTAVVVVTLALGIGANTAVFSVMNSVLLRALPVRNPDRLYYLRMADGQSQPPSASNTGDSNTSFSEPVFEALRERRDIFDDVIAYAPLSNGKVPVRYGETPEEAEGDEVSGNFFTGLSVPILLGRSFNVQEERDHAAVAVISYNYWTRRFARDPAILGQTLHIKGVPFIVIGIAARGFLGIDSATSTDLWIPLQSRPELNAWGNPAEVSSLYGTPKWWCLPLIARLRSGVTPAQAQSALQSAFGEAAKAGIGTIDPKQWKPLLDFFPALGIQGYNEQYKEPLQMLMGLVLLVLLIACTNVALLLVARNEIRQREFSLKLAIGAERRHLFRQLLAESLLLVAAGAMLGWAFANGATDALASWSGIESDLRPDRVVLLFTVGISVISALAFGLAPLLMVLRAPISGVLRAASSNLTPDRRRAIGGKVLMACQVSICLLLLVAAALLLQTLRNYHTQDLGMRTEGLVVFGVTPHRATTSRQTLAFYRSLLERVRALPGVRGATLMENRIGSGWSNNNDDGLDGFKLVAKFGPNASVRSNNVGPDCFHVLGVPILQGRDISESDTPDSPPVVVVNETFVQRFLPDGNPLGHKVRDNRTIVGVVKDSKYTRVDERPRPMAYYPAFQSLGGGATMHVEVRAEGDPLNLLNSIRRLVLEMDPDVPLEKPMSQQAQFEESYAMPATFARLAGFFGGLAALLVATGLYGTLSYRTNRRTTEIGLRLAVGAQRGQVLWAVIRESLVVTSFGVALGFPLALLCARLLKSMLYQVSEFDAVSFTLATLCVGLIGALAAFLPAWRAAKVDPIVALRYE